MCGGRERACRLKTLYPIKVCQFIICCSKGKTKEGFLLPPDDDGGGPWQVSSLERQWLGGQDRQEGLVHQLRAVVLFHREGGSQEHHRRHPGEQASHVSPVVNVRRRQADHEVGEDHVVQAPQRPLHVLLLQHVAVLVVKVAERPQEPEQGPAAPDRGEVVHVEAEDVPADAAEDVDGEHPLPPEEGLRGGPEVVQRVAVHQQVQQVAVEEGGGEEPPELPARDGLVVLAAPRGEPPLAGLLQEEGQAVELDEHVRHLPVPRVGLELLHQARQRVLQGVALLLQLQPRQLLLALLERVEVARQRPLKVPELEHVRDAHAEAQAQPHADSHAERALEDQRRAPRPARGAAPQVQRKVRAARGRGRRVRPHPVVAVVAAAAAPLGLAHRRHSLEAQGPRPRPSAPRRSPEHGAEARSSSRQAGASTKKKNRKKNKKKISSRPPSEIKILFLAVGRDKAKTSARARKRGRLRCFFRPFRRRKNDDRGQGKAGSRQSRTPTLVQRSLPFLPPQ
mmetsp:Transcript_9392/g.26722  ORF Transcript_9392/g.26722 Transcript_9392/m.26722 type:complete len:509 (+) Transcript_9392:1021-2547(+)